MFDIVLSNRLIASNKSLCLYNILPCLELKAPLVNMNKTGCKK